MSRPEFDIEKSDKEIEETILQGSYTFADYAICFWAYHLESAAKEVVDYNSDTSQFLVECLGVFLDLHWVNTSKTYSVSNALDNNLNTLQHHVYFDKICQAVAAAKSWLRPTWKEPTEDDVLRLSRIISCIRKILENMVSTNFFDEGNRRPH